MKYSIKSMILGGVALFALSMCLTSCNGALEDILGAQDNPAPNTETPSDSGSSTVSVTSITLSQSSINLTIGGTETHTLTVTNVAPDDATDKTYTWSSEDTGIATVVDGVVTAVSAGIVVIKATANDGSGVEGKCTVKVIPPALMTGKFTINGSHGQVQFSRGNLQATYDGTAWTWDFAAFQWEFIGDNTITATGNGNTSIDGDGTLSAAGTVDLFGFVGNSTPWTAATNGVAIYGISNSDADANYGTVHPENLRSDWGNTIGNGWRTLTEAEWEYLFDNHTKGWATVNGVNGYVIRPDGVTTAVASSYDATAWATEETGGSLFLPAAGVRNVSTVKIDGVGTYGWYWSSTSLPGHDASNVHFDSGGITTGGTHIRCHGHSVRLVQDVPAP